MSRRKHVIHILSFILLFQGSALAADVDVILAHLAKRAQQTYTIQSDFVQEKHLAAFNETLASQGYFVFQRPDSLRWEYRKPSRSGFIVRGKKGWRWDTSVGFRQTFDITTTPEMEAVAGQIIAWTTFDLDWLRSRYSIEVMETEPLALRLLPTGKAIKEFLKYMLVRFATGGNTVEVIELHETDGDWTRITFISPRLNEILAAPLFEAPQ